MVQTAIRNQFTFTSTSRELALLLTLNVSSTTGAIRVNVVAISSAAGDCIPRNPLPTECKPCSTRHESKVSYSAGGQGGCNPPLLVTRMIVGTTNPNNSAGGGAGDPTSPDPRRTNALQNQQFRENLRQLNIEFTEQPVVHVINTAGDPGTPGIIRVFTSALECNSIPLLALYQSEGAFAIPLDTLVSTTTGQTRFADTGTGFIFEVPADQVVKANKILEDIVFSTLSESSLCINADNVEDLVGVDRHSKPTHHSKAKRSHRVDHFTPDVEHSTRPHKVDRSTRSHKVECKSCGRSKRK